MAEPRNAPAAPAVRRADEPRDRADRRAGEERPRREPSEGDSPERDRPGRARPASGPGDQDGRERPRADPDRADEERPAPGGAEPGAADGEHPAGDPPAQDQEDQERAERERAAGRFRERSRDRLLDEQEEEGGAAVGMGATSRAHRQARGSYQVGGDHTLFDRTVFHQAHIGDVHLRLDSRQAVGAVSGPVPESELRRVRRIYLEPEGYVDLQQALRRQRVLVLAAAPGAGRTCTALALLDELTQGRPPAADGPQDGVRAGGPAEPPARVSRVSPETAVPQLTATVQGNGGQRHGYLLELPSGHGNPGLPPGELELDALAAALAGVGSYAVLVVAAGPTATPLLSGRYGRICPPAPTEELLRARLAAHLAGPDAESTEAAGAAEPAGARAAAVSAPAGGADADTEEPGEGPGSGDASGSGDGPGDASGDGARGTGDEAAARATWAAELADDPELRAGVGLEDLRPAEAELLADLIAAHVFGRLTREELLGGCRSLAPQQAQEWFAGADREIAGAAEETGRSAATVLHPTASRIALAVLNGAVHSTVAEAAHLLTWELAVARDPGNTPARPLFCDDPVSDLAYLRAELTEGEVETAGISAPARIVRYRGSALPAAVLAEVWDRHHPAREPMVRWMRLLADDPRPEIWVRAALASGELCARDFANGYEKLVRPMATARTTQRRAFAATVLDQTARHESHRPAVRALVRDWTRSDSPRLRWTAALALGFGHAAPVEAALDGLARIGTDEEDDQAPLASHSVVRLLSGPDDRAVLRRLADWTGDQRVPYQDLGLLTVVRLALTTVGEVWDGEASPDLGDYLDWPLPLALAVTRPDRTGPLADLMWTALRTPRSHEAATDCLEFWLRGAVDDDGPDTRAGLAALLPALLSTDSERRLLDWLLRRMMNDPDDPLPNARGRELWHLATGGRPGGDHGGGREGRGGSDGRSADAVGTSEEER
ncbi:hypothetical protein OG535_05995 [Kitasatospora sp. NBC_00085]|uniref:hypothetical protein n=1 Tax=unclassified Kitasatospora TaxID=2633591 RepID=UPI003252DEE0